MPIDYGRLIGRAWEIFTRTPALWLLGLISGLSTLFLSINSDYTTYTRPPLNLLLETGSTSAASAGSTLGSCLGLLLLFVLSFVGAAAEAGIIATTDHVERTGQKVPFAEAWGLGWRKMFPVWLATLLFLIIAVVIGIIIVVPFVVALGAEFFAIFGGINSSLGGTNTTPGAGGLAAVGVICGCILAIIGIPVLIALGLIRQYAVQGIVLENQGIGEAFSQGWKLLRANLGSSIVMIIILVVIEFIALILSGIVSAIVAGIATVLNPPAQRLLDNGLHPVLLLLAILAAALAILVAAPFTAYLSVLWTLFYRNRRQLPNSDLTPGGMMPVPAGAPPYGSPYSGPPYGGAYGAAPPAYTPPGGYTPPPTGPAAGVYTPPPVYGPPPTNAPPGGYTPPPAGPAPGAYTPPPVYGPPPTGPAPGIYTPPPVDARPEFVPPPPTVGPEIAPPPAPDARPEFAPPPAGPVNYGGPVQYGPPPSPGATQPMPPLPPLPPDDTPQG